MLIHPSRRDSALSDEPTIPRGDETPASIADLSPGDRIDRYVIREQIGEGGFAIVYLAEQTEPVARTVALKIIKLGMDTKEVLARFEAERQALALMEHANVAKVFDAGMTESGRPYFVMEHVPGESITDYCDRQRLSVDERLELFMQACSAVQHAHQKGIIHRDIKPTNVLVTAKGEKPTVKVIDFGVAKALHQRLTDSTIHTMQGQFLGTPEYMSPEQAEMTGLDVDTRTDIYSLGVLLYELLTGDTPFDSQRLRSAPYLDIQRIIREEDPPKPSTRLSSMGERGKDVARCRKIDVNPLRKRIKGELDWIVMKALEKDRTRRYETANGLARDVQRYLDDEPVEAGPPSATYRLRKMIHRNRVAVMAVLAVSVSVLAGLAVAVIFAVQANQARKEAVVHQVELEQEQARLQVAQDELQDFYTRYGHHTLAVLPMTNVSGDPNQDFLAIGMTRALVEELDMVEAIHVKSIDATYKIADSQRTIVRIARDLAVNLLVRSSVMRVGEQVQLDVRLLHGEDGESFWSNSYEGEWSRIDALQRKVSEDIVDAIKLKLTPQDQMRLAREQIHDPKAREAYFKGLHKLIKPNQEAAEKAIEFFDRAIEIDPDYAQAYAGKARALSSMILMALRPPMEYMPEARDAALKAIEIDDTLSEAWTVLGMVQLHFDWDWDASEKSFRRGLELNPNSAEAYLGLATYNASIGEFDLAIEQLRTAVQLDPATVLVNDQYSYVPFVARRLDVAIEFAEIAFDLDDGYWITHAWYGLSLAWAGRMEEAIAAVDEAVRLNSDMPMALVMKATVYAMAGQTEKATVMLEDLLELTLARYTCPFEIATVFLALGRRSEAFEYLHMAYEYQSECMPFLGSDMRMDEIRNDPEYQDIMDAVGVPYRGPETPADGR